MHILGAHCCIKPLMKLKNAINIMSRECNKTFFLMPLCCRKNTLKFYDFFYTFNHFFFVFLFIDFDFSLNNQYIASSSLDKTVRVWDIPNGLCLRVIYGVTSQLCIRFHPVSANQHFIVLIYLYCKENGINPSLLCHLSHISHLTQENPTCVIKG